MEYEHIIYIKDNGVATIKLNRPKAYNALCKAVNHELEHVLRNVAGDMSVRVLILTGGEKVFAAGADITEMMNATPLDAEKVATQAHNINDILSSFPLPVIAAVNGMALGGGLELALACDFRIVGQKAMLGLPEVGLGILPGAGGTQRLAKLVGVGRAKEIIMLGRNIKGVEAYEMGLATKAVADDQVMVEALQLAEELKKKPAAALRMAKTAIEYGANHDIDTGKLFEKMLFSLAFSTADQREGMSAFQEKRAPEYRHTR